VTHHVSSAWAWSWREDLRRVEARMPAVDRARWQAEGYSTVRSRSLFMAAALGLGMKVVYVTYVMEQAHVAGVAGGGIPLEEYAA
jgi:hypothetical protein